jgi:nicotinamide phosphoribosyltransferase
MKSNFILMSDAYKMTHWFQYPEKTEHIYSYFESRGGEFPNTLFYGLQAILKKWFVGKVVTNEMIGEAADFCYKVFGEEYFNYKGWKHIVEKHDGYLPIRIKAVPEGLIVPNRNVLMTVENTDPAVPWLTNFCETVLVQCWYPVTVATQSYHIKQLIKKYCEETGCDFSPFMLHDFGFRGVSSVESAGLGGSAHLINFMGTDTLEGIRYAMEYYNSDVCGFSVMAAEHSTVTIYGKENEAKAYENFMEKCPHGIISIVCDSYDTINATKEIFGSQLKQKIIMRDGKVVLRPDSGDPTKMSFAVVDALWDKFGGSVNQKGFKVLNPKVGVIYGDGINYISINDILFNLRANGYAASNMVFGMGGALLQHPNRDTLQFAFKCSNAIVNGFSRDVYKDPITSTMKKSKSGRLKLIRNNGTFATVAETPFYDEDNILKLIFENGELLTDHKFEDIRKRSEE